MVQPARHKHRCQNCRNQWFCEEKDCPRPKYFPCPGCWPGIKMVLDAAIKEDEAARAEKLDAIARN